MKILVIGGGGREHALVSKLRESPRVESICCAPGNGGIAAEARCVAVDAGDVPALLKVAGALEPDLTVVGPELPLVAGLTDAFRERNWPVVGPSQQAAQLEGSKIFAKEFLERHRIPTARMYGTYARPEEAYAALQDVRWPLVIKADGLCAGKGVLLADQAEEARAFIQGAMERGELGSGGRRLLFEETLEGEELSFILLSDGQRYAPLVPTRDHKRVFDQNLGPNTGGMGAYSADELLPEDLRARILSEIVDPTFHGLAADGIRYSGFLYIGLILTREGPKVLEFNCRLGDPETQAIVARMDFDLAEVLLDVARGRLEPEKLRWKKGASVCIVLASGGYPGKFETGKVIHGLTGVDQAKGVRVFHAGSKLADGGIVTSGGRVLGVTASAASLPEAITRAYAAVDGVAFDGMHYRKDIGSSGMERAAAGK